MGDFRRERWFGDKKGSYFGEKQGATNQEQILWQCKSSSKKLNISGIKSLVKGERRQKSEKFC